MHETIFSKEIIRVLNDKLKSLETDCRVIRVNVKLSPLSHVRPETLKSAFLQMAKVSNLENISLNIKPSEIELECKFCGRRFLVEEPLFVCPDCKRKDFNVKEEPEFFVESVEIEKKDGTIDKGLK